MDMTKLEAYLDGELSPAESAALEASLADPAIATQLELARRQRATRAAALSSYAPSPAESVALADRILDAASAPVASLVWLRRSAAVAAAVALAALAFYTGRVTTSATPVASSSTSPTVFVVSIQGSNGNVIQEQRFDSLAEAQAYAKTLADQQQDQTAETVALASPGIF